MTVDDVFNNDDEEVTQLKKRKLVPLVYTEEERAAVPPSAAHLTALATAAATSAEEKRKSIKNLIERIPTAKDDLFAFSLDWSMVDSVCIVLRFFQNILNLHFTNGSCHGFQHFSLNSLQCSFCQLSVNRIVRLSSVFDVLAFEMY